MNYDNSNVTGKRKGTPMRLTVLFSSTICFSLFLGACSDGSNSQPWSTEPSPQYDFSAVDERFQEFLDESDTYDGISVILVDKSQGVVHEKSFGDHTEDIVVLLASTTKAVSAALLVALDESDAINFDIDAPIGDYLPWDGVYGDSTTTQLLSNTSGIPGRGAKKDYGVHECQYNPDAIFEDCAKLIYSNELPGTQAPGTAFSYGGSQWHLSGAVAEQVTNSEWAQAFDKYIAQPCDLEVFKFGNMVEQSKYDWTGHPDSLAGLGNPHMAGGAISNLQDMAKLLLMHLHDGMCGENRVMSRDGVLFMQVDRTSEISRFSYGLGWWMTRRSWMDEEDELFLLRDTGVYGSTAWLDTKRMIGGFVPIDAYTGANPNDAWTLVLDEIVPLIGQIVDDARAAAADQ
jgi:CubicO group peptidase (beta-lactamase class C family)